MARTRSRRDRDTVTPPDRPQASKGLQGLCLPPKPEAGVDPPEGIQHPVGRATRALSSRRTASGESESRYPSSTALGSRRAILGAPAARHRARVSVAKLRTRLSAARKPSRDSPLGSVVPLIGKYRTSTWRKGAGTQPFGDATADHSDADRVFCVDRQVPHVSLHVGVELLLVRSTARLPCHS